jgi:tRNA (guanine-N7-)-methyltransferase
VVVATALGEGPLRQHATPLDFDALAPGGGPWEVELGFGKGRYLLTRASAEPENRFLGVEVAHQYFRVLAGRARRRGLRNLVVVRGEALGLLATVLPTGFARALHVYFPDPWPKARHQRRRLFDPESVDLVLGVLAPGGTLFFATDFLEYGESVVELLSEVPWLSLRRRVGPWPEGARTNYERKYLEEGRAILRLEARREGATQIGLHPAGGAGVTVGYRRAVSLEPAAGAPLVRSAGPSP